MVTREQQGHWDGAMSDIGKQFTIWDEKVLGLRERVCWNVALGNKGSIKLSSAPEGNEWQKVSRPCNSRKHLQEKTVGVWLTSAPPEADEPVLLVELGNGPGCDQPGQPGRCRGSS